MPMEENEALPPLGHIPPSEDLNSYPASIPSVKGVLHALEQKVEATESPATFIKKTQATLGQLSLKLPMHPDLSDAHMQSITGHISHAQGYAAETAAIMDAADNSLLTYSKYIGGNLLYDQGPQSYFEYQNAPPQTAGLKVEKEAFVMLDDMGSFMDGNLQLDSGSPGPDTGETPSNLKKRRPESHRMTFMKTRGFALYTDTNNRMLEHMMSTPLSSPAEDVAVFEQWAIENHFTTTQSFSEFTTTLTSAGTLFYMSQILTKKFSAYIGQENTFGFTLEDERLVDGQAQFGNGFGDLDFTAHFAPVVANDMIAFLVDEGVITAEQRNSLTLTDWADMIGSSWFSHAMHLYALTRNGMYASLGKAPEQYVNQEVVKKRASNLANIPKGTPSYTYKLETDNENGTVSISVAPHPGIIKALRDAMHAQGDTVGCPVARKATRLPVDILENDPHAKRLIDTGQLTILDGRQTDGFVRVAQTDTAIDHTLQYIANQLRSYDGQHGTPYVSQGPGPDRKPTIEHRRSQPSHALHRPALPTQMGAPHA